LARRFGHARNANHYNTGGLCHFGVPPGFGGNAESGLEFSPIHVQIKPIIEAERAVTKVCTRLIFFAFACSLALFAPAARAADMTAGQVTRLLFTAAPGTQPDLSNKDLSALDLSGLDFKKAKLDGVNFYGADLSNANLSGASLKSARLDRSTLIGADFSGADLSHASLLRPNVFADMTAPVSRHLTFAGARLAGANFNGRLDGVDFTHADLTGALFGPRDPREEVLITPMMSLASADFTGAVLVGADFSGNAIENAKFIDADLSHANLRHARLGGVDFSNANLEGADLTGADIRGAMLKTARGIGSVVGITAH
jgi:uncharacterized protein YjbI with pentapeptide repeats